jgi:hypothetical protein
MTNPIRVQAQATNELCSCCDTVNACPHDHKPPPSCPDYVWDGSYTPEEEVDMEDFHP